MLRVLALVPLVGCGTLFNLDKVEPPDRPADSALPCSFRDVSAGRGHSCAIDGDGAAWCWGLNDHGQVQLGGARNIYTPTKIGLPEVVDQIAAGRAFTCARLASGKVFCWGENSGGQLGTGAGGVATAAGMTEVNLGDTAAAVDAGSDFACAIRATDRAVTCWGNNRFQSLGRDDAAITAALPEVIAGTEGTKALAVGHRHSCLIDASDKVSCWGRGELSQTGTAASTSNAAPNPVPNLGPAIAVGAGGRSSCAVEIDHNLRCWGRGNSGELGNNTFTPSSQTPTAAVLSDALTVEVGTYGACGLRDTGNVACWGAADAGNGVVEVSPSQHISTIDGVEGMSHGFFHTCTRAGDTISCWGYNTEGQLGRGSRSSVSTPTQVPGLASITKVTAGNGKVCALMAPNRIYCWGYNGYGELGDGTLRTAFSPLEITTGFANVAGMASGFSRTCVWSPSVARCWGANAFGQVGNSLMGRERETPSVVAVIGAYTINQIGMGQYHSCASTSNGLYCWGLNDHGQLGTGTTTNSATPVSVLGGTITDVAGGGRHTCAIDATGLHCWGANQNGQLGDGTKTEAHTIPAALPLTSPTEVGTGESHTCALLASGDVYCWGSNDRGQLGLGNRTSTVTPVKVALPVAAVSIVVSQFGTCATLSNKQLYCWGAAENDELALSGQLTDVLSPTVIPDLTDVSAVSLSVSGGCAILPDATLRCWGDTIMLGNGDRADSMPLPAQLSCR